MARSPPCSRRAPANRSPRARHGSRGRPRSGSSATAPVAGGTRAPTSSTSASSERLLIRRVTLSGATSGIPYVMAEALVAPDRLPELVARALLRPGGSLGRLLAQGRLETRRELRGHQRCARGRGWLPPRRPVQLAAAPSHVRDRARGAIRRCHQRVELPRTPRCCDTGGGVRLRRRPLTGGPASPMRQCARRIGQPGWMSPEQNKARALELVERVMNGHDLAALEEFTSNPAVLGSGRGLLGAFPDLRAQVSGSSPRVTWSSSSTTSGERNRGRGCSSSNPRSARSTRRSCWRSGSTTKARSSTSGSDPTSSRCRPARLGLRSDRRTGGASALSRRRSDNVVEG